MLTPTLCYQATHDKIKNVYFYLLFLHPSLPIHFLQQVVRQTGMDSRAPGLVVSLVLLFPDRTKSSYSTYSHSNLAFKISAYSTQPRLGADNQLPDYLAQAIRNQTSPKQLFTDYHALKIFECKYQSNLIRNYSSELDNNFQTYLLTKRVSTGLIFNRNTAKKMTNFKYQS